MTEIAMTSESARQRLEEVLDDIKQFPLCGPSDDSDKQTAVVYGFRNLLTRLKRAARLVADNQTRAEVQYIPMPDDIYAVYDAIATIDALASDIQDDLYDELMLEVSPKGKAMDWKSNVDLIYEPLRELTAHCSDALLRDVLNEGTPELTESEYDNWNGGTTYFTLTIHVPAHVFVQIEDRLDAVESTLRERIKALTRAETNNFINSVVIQPGMAAAQRVVPASETPFWLSGHFKLFISHVSIDKLRATNLRGVLKSYAISCFVAHEDIAPTKEWQVEIEKALFSMDALTAVLTEQFPQSKWTDQEVGVALGRGIAVLPIRAGIDPYGLMGKFQGVGSAGRSVGDVANAIVATLLKHPKTRHRLVSCLVEQLLASADATQAASKLDALELADELAGDQLVRIRDHAATNAALFEDAKSRRRTNDLLAKHGFDPIQVKASVDEAPDDDIPF